MTTTDYKIISPGISGHCDECQSNHGLSFDPAEDCKAERWGERDRLFYGLRINGTDEYLVEFWDDDARQAVEDGFIDPTNLFASLCEYVHDRDIEPTGEEKAAAFSDRVSRGDLFDEGGFSWQGCDLCDSTLGGNLYDAHGVCEDGAVDHLSICTDCLMDIG